MFKFDTKIKDLHKFTKKIDDLHTFATRCYNAIILKRISTDDITNTEVFVGGKKTMLSELPTKLKDLPTTLKGLVGVGIYIKAKAKFNDRVNVLTELKNKIIVKTKVSNSTSANTTLLCYQGKRKKLNSYSSTNLNELPPTLIGFCFDFNKEDWGEVQSTYESWGDVKTNVSTWGNLMN